MPDSSAPPYIFTVDWFSHHIGEWNELLKEFQGKPELRFLEIGSYEGRSTVWLLENILTAPSSTLVCVDSYDGGKLYERLKLDTARARRNFELNTARFGNKVRLLDGVSGSLLRNSDFREESFEFIYIDGSHVARDVLEDAVLSWRLLKPEGILIFDDYGWGLEQDELQKPKIAIDAFLKIYKGEYDLLHEGHQIAIRKRKVF